LQSGTVSNE